MEDKVMKLHTTPEQTAKLIELGFEKPKGWYADGVTNNINLDVNINRDQMMFNYSIGELIGMLPTYIHIYNLRDEISGEWFWNITLLYRGNIKSKELVDVLFDQIVKLKEEGVI